jgi:hypothetical protein
MLLCNLSKLNYFTVKFFIHNDDNFAYLKRILNNLNQVEKFKLHLQISAQIEWLRNMLLMQILFV